MCVYTRLCRGFPSICEPGCCCVLAAIEISVRDFSSAAAANTKKKPGVVLPAGDPRALLLRLTVTVCRKATGNFFYGSTVLKKICN